MSKTSNRLIDRAFVITSLLLVVAGIGAGFGVLGSPARQRRISLDAERIQDLNTIASQLQFQAQEPDKAKSNLPEQLPENLKLSRDPVTGEPYEYRRIDESTYKLCATFTTDSREHAEGSSWFDAQWQHPEGRYCFEIEASSASPTAKPLPPPAPAQ